MKASRHHYQNFPLIVGSLLIAASLNLRPGSHAQDSASLELGKPITQVLSGGAKHSYQIALIEGQFLRAVVDQRGVNVLITLFSPDGRKIADLDSPNGTQGPEPFSLIAEVSGFYRVQVHSFLPNAPLGRYEIRIEEIRAATPQDKARVAAERAFAEATITSQGTADSLRQALLKYEKVIPLWQALEDRRQEANTLAVIGLIHRQLGEYRQALDIYRQALPLTQAVEDRRGEAMTLYQLGATYTSLNEPRQALAYVQQALAIYEQIGDRPMIASALGSLGIVHSELGEQMKALELYNRALALKQAVGDSNGEATLHNNTGFVQNQLGERQQALEAYQRALPLYRMLGDRAGEGTTFNNIGALYGNLKEHQKSLEYYQQSLALGRGSRSGEATTLSNIGKAHNDLGNYRKALEYYEQSLRLFREMGNRHGEAVTLNNLGRAFRGLGELPKALDCFNQVLPLQQTLNNRAGEAITRYHIALTLRDLSQPAEAHAQSAAALALVETLRGKVAGQGLRTSYLASVQKYYELEIELLMRLHQHQPTQGFDADALHACERAHARTLLESLSETRAGIREGVAPELLERERTLQLSLDTKAAAQTRLLNGKPTAEQTAAMANEISALALEYEQVQAQIRRTSPRYAALTQPVPLGLKEIQSALLDSDTLLLEFALGEERSWLWAVTPVSLKSFALPKRADIETAARRVHEVLAARNQAPPGETPAQRQRRLDQADAAYPAAAAALSRILLDPVAAELGNKRLLIVSDGVLQYIPFGALPENANQPLIKNHEIINLPSASVLGVLRRETAGRKTANKTLAVLADPVFQHNDPRLPAASAVRAGETEFVRLRFSRAEAEEIAALSPPEQTLKALDFAANRDLAVSAALGDYRIVHFATHAVINQQHPELSGIVLSQVDERGQPHDGFLRLHEIYNLRLGAELVVLSACETALGKEVKGEGIIGLTRGFMYAGAPRVAASLWRTDDRAAAELMKRFYRHLLGEGMTAAAALRAAQVSLWQDKRWATPYYWAAFTLQGEWK